MSSISISEAQSFSVQDKPDRYYYSGRVVDQLFDVLPLEPIDGHGKLLTLAPHADLPNHAAVIGFGGQGVPATRPTTQQQAHSFSHYAARVEIDSLVAGQYSSTHDVVKAELDLKAAAILALYRQHLIRGDSGSSGEFDGLIQLQQETFEADDGNPNGGVVQPGEIEKVGARATPPAGVVPVNLESARTTWEVNPPDMSQASAAPPPPVYGPSEDIAGGGEHIPIVQRGALGARSNLYAQMTDAVAMFPGGPMQLTPFPAPAVPAASEPALRSPLSLFPLLQSHSIKG